MGRLLSRFVVARGRPGAGRFDSRLAWIITQAVTDDTSPQTLRRHARAPAARAATGLRAVDHAEASLAPAPVFLLESLWGHGRGRGGRTARSDARPDQGGRRHPRRAIGPREQGRGDAGRGGGSKERGPLGSRDRPPGCDLLHRGGTGRRACGPLILDLRSGLAANPRRAGRKAIGSVPRGRRGVVVAGNDRRGVLFGVGRLLRELRMARGRRAPAEGFPARNRAPVSAPRPPARLSPQDQLLRRLGPRPVGAVHPRPRRLRHQRHRADPAAFRR